MKIVFIGSGNVATHLSMALQNAGNEIVQIYSRTLINAQILAEKISNASAEKISGASAEKINGRAAERCLATDDINKICTNADAYIFSVKDDALREIACVLGSKISGIGASPLFIHTAGSVPMDVFKGIVYDYGVLYPMQTFSKGRKVDFNTIPCFIEASNEATLDQIKTLASSISSRVQEASSENRKKMHLAAVFACNFTNHCYRLAERIVNEEGFDFSLFQPLIEETAKKVSEMSPRDAQTGPMVRNDKTIMEAQMQLINDDRTRKIYELMAESVYMDRLELRA